MGFQINKVGKGNQKPEGHYVTIGGIDHQIYEITMSASGNVCVKIWDYLRREHQIITICTVEELVSNIDGATYHQY